MRSAKAAEAAGSSGRPPAARGRPDTSRSATASRTETATVMARERRPVAEPGARAPCSAAPAWTWSNDWRAACVLKLRTDEPRGCRGRGALHRRHVALAFGPAMHQAALLLGTAPTFFNYLRHESQVRLAPLERQWASGGRRGKLQSQVALPTIAPQPALLQEARRWLAQAIRCVAHTLIHQRRGEAGMTANGRLLWLHEHSPCVVG